jgi:uncharacterized protein (TIGR04255 family)
MNAVEPQIYEDVKYRRNFLTDVIARVDLVSPINGLADVIPKELSTYALKSFPIDEPKRLFHQEVAFGPDRLATRRTEATEWNFHGKNREKRLAITREHFFITYKEYETYEPLRESFVGISDQFFKTFEEAQPSRIGLRYINTVKLINGDPLDWTGLINDDLLGMFSFKVPYTNPSRIFHNTEYKYEEFNLRFQFGIHNPDYPAAIRQKVFILDFDAYFNGFFDHNQVADMLDGFHGAVQVLFERSITDDLRAIMNAEE